MKGVFRFMLLFIFISSGSAWAGEKITICSFGGSTGNAIAQAFGNPFTQETGIEVNVVSFPTYAKMKAQVQSGNVEWDVVDTESRMYARGVKDGIFEPIDANKIPMEDFMEGGIKKFGVGLYYYSYNVTYRTDKWPEDKGPKSWKDIWNVKKFPGPRGFKFTAYSTLEAALLADGVPVNQVYPIDIDRAFNKLNELKPYIGVFWKTGSQGQQVMRAHEVDAGCFLGGRMQIIADKGVPVACGWNQQIVDLDYFTILKGSHHKEAAMKFIASTANPKQQAVFAGLSKYSPAGKKAYEYIPKNLAKQLPTYADNLKNALFIKADWYAEHEAELERRWEVWKMQ